MPISNLSVLEKLCFEKLLENIPTYVFWKDAKSVYQGCNLLFAQLAGLKDPKEIIGLMDPELPWSEEYTSMYLAEDELVLSTKKPLTAKEAPLIDVSKQKKTILVNKYPLVEQGEVIGILGVFIDITAEKKAQQYRLEKEEAILKGKHMRVAAGSIAHDLRTPMASVGLAFDVVAKFIPKLINAYEAAKQSGLSVESIEDEQYQYLKVAMDRIKQEIKYASVFIDLILGNLKFNYIDTSSYHMISIKPLLDKIIEQYPYKNGEKQLLHLSIKDNFAFWGNQFYFKNIINNLLKNALFYICQEQKGEIFVQSELGKEFNKIYIKDTAKGIPPTIMESIFDEFYSSREGGTGLGLSFCKKVMHSFHGDILVESKVGAYVTFTLLFPVSYGDKLGEKE